jgi:large subunit ribosomal protein L25
MATRQAATSLDTLPVRLRNFFARYPPQIYSAAKLTPQAVSRENATEGNPSPLTPSSTPLPTPYTPSRMSKNTSAEDREASNASIRALLQQNDPEHPNPFLPYRNPESGRWRGATISLRRQNELVKLAIQHGVEPLLPPGRKSTVFKEVMVHEKGLRIKGTGIGQKVKGHKWERTLGVRLEKRREAMLNMPEMIRAWKQV